MTEPEPGTEVLSDEEDSDSYYREISWGAQCVLVSDLIAQVASFRES